MGKIRFKTVTVLNFSKSGEQEYEGKYTYKKMQERTEDFPTIARTWLKKEHTNKDGTRRPWNPDCLCLVFQAANRGFCLFEKDLEASEERVSQAQNGRSE